MSYPEPPNVHHDVAFYLEMMQDDDVHIRSLAISRLETRSQKDRNDPRVSAALIARLGDSSMVVRTNALSALEKCGDLGSCLRYALALMGDDPSPSVRLAAVEIIGRSRRPEYRRYLEARETIESHSGVLVTLWEAMRACGATTTEVDALYRARNLAPPL